MRWLDDSDQNYWQRFEDRCRLRRLPGPIRRQLRRIRNPYHLNAPLGVVMERIAEIGEGKGWVRERTDDAFRPHAYIPAIHQRQIHRQLVRDRALAWQLRNEVDSVLQDANRDRRLPPNHYPRGMPDCRPPSDGIWSVPSELGFGLATQFEAKPEGFALGIAQRTWDRLLRDCFDGDDVGVDQEFDLSVLDWGSFGGMTTHALASTKPPVSSLSVFERDVVGEPTDSPHARSLNNLGDDQFFDLIVVSLPPPGAGGMFQYRNRYKQGSQRHAVDMGTMGPTRWRKALQFLSQMLPALLADRGEIVFLVPESVRVERSYEPATGLLEGLNLNLVNQGLVITNDLGVVETRPPAQPFVGISRPARRCIIAHRPSDDTSGEEGA